MKNPKIKKRHKWQGTEIFSVIVLTIIAILIVVPFWNAVVISLETSAAFSRKPFSWLPGEFTLANYDYLLFQNSGAMITAYKATIGITVVGTFLGMLVSVMGAYAFSRKFPGKKFFFMAMLFTMFFGGGLIPTYLLIKSLGMIDTIWAIIIPGAFSVWNMIIARTYYQGIPTELREAADVDGANEMTFFFTILLPVCMPIIAVLCLWSFVGMWNSYFDALIYLDSASKKPLQVVLRSILIQNKPESGMISDMQSTAARAQLAELLKYATIIVSSLPLLVMYPFFQKYFDAGIMVGSVKG